jgi:membrane-associated phospholipid phosphatase
MTRFFLGLLGLVGVIAPLQARAAPDPVVFWNNQANRAIQVTSTDPFRASRALALESIAVFDTIRSVSGGPAFLVHLAGPLGVRPDLAAASAAHAMLLLLFPTQRVELDAALATWLGSEPSGPASEAAVTFGAAMADAVYAARDGDGWDASGRIRTGTGPGEWRPTPPAFLPPLDPQWATMPPFAMVQPDQFRPPVPPRPDSAALHDAAVFVASIGAAKSTVRTEEQSEIARYWSDAIGTYAPAGHWNAITARLVEPLGLSIDSEAELFAELNVAVADSAIAIADAKYTYWYWRPITVIRAGAAGSPAIPDWSSLLDTPNHPSYISGHSGFSGAAAVVLEARFGSRPFRFASDSLPGVTRSFTSFEQAAEEAAASRVYGGIHYPFDNAAGLATGRAVGKWTLGAFRRIAEDRGPVIALDRPTATGGQKAGYVLDNVAPLTMATVRLNGGRPFRIAVDQHGRFTIPPVRLGLAGQRLVAMTATSKTGREVTVSWDIGGTGGDDGSVTAPLTVR